MTLSYSDMPPTDPSRMLATYGFVADQNEVPAIYSKLMFDNPSPQLLDIGYHPDQLLFDTTTGDISPKVWDVLLYARLERKMGDDVDQAKQAFYEAHTNSDEVTKQAIHEHFWTDTHRALLRHVNHILAEVDAYIEKLNSHDANKHPRIPLLNKHHKMVQSTFAKVKANLELEMV